MKLKGYKSINSYLIDLIKSDMNLQQLSTKSNAYCGAGYRSYRRVMYYNIVYKQYYNIQLLVFIYTHIQHYIMFNVLTVVAIWCLMY